MHARNTFYRAAIYHRALGSGRRLFILELLLVRPYTITKLQQELRIRRSCVYRHLAVLRHASFVQGRREGMYVYYAVREPSIVRSILQHAYVLAKS